MTADFCYGYDSFSPTGVALQIPGGFTFDMMRYWDGQPVYFVCCERAPSEEGQGAEKKLGRIFWCVAIEVLDGEAEDGEEREDGEGQVEAGSADANAEEHANNDDVD